MLSTASHVIFGVMLLFGNPISASTMVCKSGFDLDKMFTTGNAIKGGRTRSRSVNIGEMSMSAGIASQFEIIGFFPVTDFLPGASTTLSITFDNDLGTMFNYIGLASGTTNSGATLASVTNASGFVESGEALKSAHMMVGEINVFYIPDQNYLVSNGTASPDNQWAPGGLTTGAQHLGDGGTMRSFESLGFNKKRWTYGANYYITWELTETDTIMSVKDSSGRNITQVMTGLVLDPADLYFWIGTKETVNQPSRLRYYSMCAADSTDPAALQTLLDEQTMKFPPPCDSEVVRLQKCALYDPIATKKPKYQLGKVNAMVFGALGWRHMATDPIPGSAVQRMYDWTNVASITCGVVGCIVLRHDGNAYMWGTANVADGDEAELRNVVKIGTGHGQFGQNLCVVRSDGTAQVWGRYSLDEQAQKDLYGDDYIDLTNVADIACDSMSAVVLKRDGTAFAWGRKPEDSMWPKGKGQFGNIFNDTSGGGVAEIGCGPGDVCFLRRYDGTAAAWGVKTFGGDGSPSSTAYTGLTWGSIAMTDVVKIGCGRQNCYLQRGDGSAEIWGAAIGTGMNNPDAAGYVNMTANVKHVDCGNQACIVIMDDGTAHTTGLATQGGDSGTVNMTGVVKGSCARAPSCWVVRDDNTLDWWGHSSPKSTGTVKYNGYADVSKTNVDYVTCGQSGCLILYLDGSVDGFGSHAGSIGGFEFSNVKSVECQSSYCWTLSDFSSSAPSVKTSAPSVKTSAPSVKTSAPSVTTSNPTAGTSPPTSEATNEPTSAPTATDKLAEAPTANVTEATSALRDVVPEATGIEAWVIVLILLLVLLLCCALFFLLMWRRKVAVLHTKPGAEAGLTVITHAPLLGPLFKNLEAGHFVEIAGTTSYNGTRQVQAVINDESFTIKMAATGEGEGRKDDTNHGNATVKVVSKTAKISPGEEVGTAAPLENA